MLRHVFSLSLAALEVGIKGFDYEFEMKRIRQCTQASDFFLLLYFMSVSCNLEVMLVFGLSTFHSAR